MTGRIPTYLKLHVDQPVPAAAEAGLPSIAQIESVCDSFCRATGWQLGYRPLAEGRDPNWLWSEETIVGEDHRPAYVYLSSRTGPVAELEDVTRYSPPSRRPGLLPSPLEPIDESVAIPLAQQIATMWTEYQQTRHALWQSEAELATAIPVVADLDDERQKIAPRLEAILKAGGEAVECCAVAAYLLDDDTSYLKLRSIWGLPSAKLVEPPRRLRGAKGDLEALSGHAVVIETTDQTHHWNPPIDCRSAVCVPISTPTMPLGTLWFFSQTERPFTDQAVNMTEIVAGRVAAELEREVLLRASQGTRRDSVLSELIQWQKERQHLVRPQLDDWTVVATPGRPHSVSTETYHWHLGTDGNLSLALATAAVQGPTAALVNAEAGSLLRCQALWTEPAQVVQAVNQSLQAGSPEGQSVGLFCGQIEPTNGKLNFATSGRVHAFVIREFGWEPLVAAVEEDGIDEDTESHDSASEVVSNDVTLSRGDIVMLVAGPQSRRSRSLHGAAIDAAHFAETAVRHLVKPLDELADLLSASWDRSDSVWDDRPTILLAKRR